MRFLFHPQADDEFDQAGRYYENCQPGLGLEFAEEVYAAVARIAEYPEAWSPMSKNTRRCLVNRFPFGVISRSNPTCFGLWPSPTCIGAPDTGKTEYELD